MNLTELVVKPAKVARIVPVSREVADDTSPAAAEAIGAGRPVTSPTSDLVSVVDHAMGTIHSLDT